MSTELVVIRHSYKSVTVDNKMGNKNDLFNIVMIFFTTKILSDGGFSKQMNRIFTRKKTISFISQK